MKRKRVSDIEAARKLLADAEESVTRWTDKLLRAAARLKKAREDADHYRGKWAALNVVALSHDPVPPRDAEPDQVSPETPSHVLDEETGEIHKNPLAEPDPLSVACTSCNVGPRAKCIWGTKKKRGSARPEFHNPRIKAAEKARAAAIESTKKEW